VEDTSFYVFNRLVSLNEVGGDPDRFGTTIKAFHRANEERLAQWPDTMIAGSTHDNKRSADVRARIDVISEMPAAWRLQVRRWSRINRRRKRMVADKTAPSANDEYLLYQTLVGTMPPGESSAEAWKDYRERIGRYVIKAAREAKTHTSWTAVNEEYESALTSFAEALLDDAATNPFLNDIRAACATFAWYGALNSVARVLLHFTVPGVPDIYQGDEIADLSLVDPDNRRPVNYDLRRDVLRSFEALAAGEPQAQSDALRAMLASPQDGRLKLWVSWKALQLRAQNPELFARGGYVAVPTTGARARHLVAFVRALGNQRIVAVAGRMFAQMDLETNAPPVGEAVWVDTDLDLRSLPADARLSNVLTGETHTLRDGMLAVGAALSQLPVGLFFVEPPAS